MTHPGFDRRRFLQGMLAAGTLLDGAGRAAADTRYARVKSSSTRVIRTIVGLRPYRPEGFVLKAERLGEQLLIHNYGHGGAGITLSWGCAELAADLLQGTPPGRAAVLGGGVIGLTTARELQRRGWQVVIYTKDLPPHTTSNVAGGFWKPVTLYNHRIITDEFRRQFRQATNLAHRRFQELVGTDHAVRWIHSLEVANKAGSLRGQLPGGDHLYPENRIVEDSQRILGLPHVRSFQTMLIEPHQFLQTLLREFQGAGGAIVVREFRSPEELSMLPETVLVNCTGLGAAALFGDTSLTPARGQLVVLLPQPEIDYCYTSPLGYMFPRRDGIVLGGSFEPGNWSLEDNPTQIAGILAGNARVARGIR